MSDVYQLASIGMLDGKQRLEAIGLNAASASLPGYRRHVVVATAFQAALAAEHEPTPASTDVTKLLASPLADSARTVLHHVDLRAGAITATGRALDLAIESENAFFMLTDGARTWLTRAGSFRVNAEGMLVGEGGLRVVGTQGDVHVPNGEVEVAPDGRILHDGVAVAALQLFEPNDRVALQAGPGSLLSAPAGVHVVDTARVRSGALEASNTDAGREMLGLMMLSRQFESLSRIVQGYDEALGRAIQELGEG